MKRSGPPARRSPLVARTGLGRSAPLDRGSGLSRSAPLLRSVAPPETAPSRSRRAETAARPGLDPSLRLLVVLRDGGCVRCGGLDVRLEVHHRRRKGMGGSKLLDHPANLICLCGFGNASGCHGWAHTWSNTTAAAAGLIVPQGEDPAAWPIRGSALYGPGEWLLDDHGERRRVA